MLGATILGPSVWARPVKAGFGRDQETAWIWMKSFGDEIDSQLHRAAQHCNRLGMIVRLSPDAVAGQLHCAKPESVNGNVADQKCSARFGRSGVGGARESSRGCGQC